MFEQLESRYIFGLYASALPSSPGRENALKHAFLQADACLSHLEAGELEDFARGLSGLCRDLCRELPSVSQET